MKVFLSSTAQDLVDYRKVADDTILRLSQQAIVMERFGPLPNEPAEECERKARECDVVVCIVAHRYGYVPEKGRGSITQREVVAAHAAGKQVWVFTVDDKHPWTEKKEQDLLADPMVLADPARVSEVAAHVAALLEFKTWLRLTFTCDTFTSPDELGRKIAVALAKAQRLNSASVQPKLGEIRTVHALQPALHFCGRDQLVNELGRWVADLASPDRVWALVAAGGTGKTAVLERVVHDLRPNEANVLVWSFYERPDADAFLRECSHLFLGEEAGPAGGRLERLERGLRDGRPHLIVLDGLERVQEDAVPGRVRGELSDQTLKMLLRALAAGLGRARALVTSRFPLVDLASWERNGYRSTTLDDLSTDAAMAVLRGWGVAGGDEQLRAAAAQVGNHALSVAVIGSYLRSFAEGDVAQMASFQLETVTGEDPRAAKLARVLAFYAERLPPEERELLARLSVLQRGFALELLEVLVDAGGQVAGVLVNAKSRLVNLLGCLRDRGLVFRYQTSATVTWTAHPFLRDSFRRFLNCPPERVFDVLAVALGAGLDKRPDIKPSEPSVLDRYERLIEATRLAGRPTEAFEFYWHGMGAFENLGRVLGEYQRGYRILAAFSPTGRADALAKSLLGRRRSLLGNELCLYARRLGRLEDAREIMQTVATWPEVSANPEDRCGFYKNRSDVTFRLGYLAEALRLADAAVEIATRELNQTEQYGAFACRARVAHATASGKASRTKIDREAIGLLADRLHARRLIDLGELTSARAVCGSELEHCQAAGDNIGEASGHVLLARIDVLEGKDPAPHLDRVRAWTVRTGDMELIIEARLISARYLLAQGDLQNALCEAEAGLLHAVSCGYRLLRIELLIAIARIRLTWPDPAKAVQSAREALDLAAVSECGYLWGEADAAQVWGEAYLANHEPMLAQRALRRALEARVRVQHPDISQTRQWLARARGG